MALQRMRMLAGAAVVAGAAVLGTSVPALASDAPAAAPAAPRPVTLTELVCFNPSAANGPAGDDLYLQDKGSHVVYWRLSGRLRNCGSGNPPRGVPIPRVPVAEGRVIQLFTHTPKNGDKFLGEGLVRASDKNTLVGYLDNSDYRVTHG